MKKNLCKICTLLLVSCSFLSNAQVGQLPFEFDGGHLYIKVRTNDSDTLRFIFDTGSTGAMIDSAAAERIGIAKENRQTVEVAGSGGAQNYTMAVGQKLQLSNLEINDMNLVMVNFAALSAATGIRLDGIVGYEIMDNYVTQMDFDNNKLLFFNNINEIDTTGYTGIPFEFNKGIMIPRFPISIQLTTGEMFTGRVMFDSGMGNTLLVSTPFNKFHHISEKLKDKSNSLSRGLNTNNVEEKAMISKMSFNGFDFGEMPISLTVNDEAQPKDGYLGIIGVDIIKGFNIILDYVNKRIYLKPNKSFNEKFKIS